MQTSEENDMEDDRANAYTIVEARMALDILRALPQERGAAERVLRIVDDMLPRVTFVAPRTPGLHQTLGDKF